MEATDFLAKPNVETAIPMAGPLIRATNGFSNSIKASTKGIIISNALRKGSYCFIKTSVRVISALKATLNLKNHLVVSPRLHILQIFEISKLVDKI